MYIYNNLLTFTFNSIMDYKKSVINNKVLYLIIRWFFCREINNKAIQHTCILLCTQLSCFYDMLHSLLMGIPPPPQMWILFTWICDIIYLQYLSCIVFDYSLWCRVLHVYLFDCVQFLQLKDGRSMVSFCTCNAA